MTSPRPVFHERIEFLEMRIQQMPIMSGAEDDNGRSAFENLWVFRITIFWQNDRFNPEIRFVESFGQKNISSTMLVSTGAMTRLPRDEDYFFGVLCRKSGQAESKETKRGKEGFQGHEISFSVGFR